MSVGVLASPISESEPTVPRLQLPATLQLGTLSLPVSALIDSGAEGNFIDLNLVRQADIPIKPLLSPLSVTAINSHILAEVTHQC